MPLTDAEIASIAEWEPIQAGFGCEINARIQGIIDRIKSTGDLGCEMVEDDGCSNYFILFAYTVADLPSFAPAHSVDGLIISLSACAFVGVIGRSRKCVGYLLHDPLQIDTVLDPWRCEGRLEMETFEAIRSSGYELLSVEEVSKLLPPGVKPYEYCFSPKPWDRVFHALFCNTD